MELWQVLTDVVVARAMGSALSVILLVGAWHKLRHRELFQSALENYRLMPQSWVASVATGLSLWELAAGGFLLLPSTRLAGAWLAGGILLTVTGAVVINLWRGHTDIDCGCGGLSVHVGEQRLSWALVVRNAILVVTLLLSLPEAGYRTLMWVDYLTVTATTLALVGLYVSANQLMANHPRLQPM